MVACQYYITNVYYVYMCSLPILYYYLCVHVSVHVCTYVLVCVRECVASNHVCMCVHAYTRMCLSCVCVFVCMHTQTTCTGVPGSTQAVAPAYTNHLHVEPPTLTV